MLGKLDIVIKHLPTSRTLALLGVTGFLDMLIQVLFRFELFTARDAHV